LKLQLVALNKKMKNVKNIHLTSAWLNNEVLFTPKIKKESFITKKIKEVATGLRNSLLTQSRRVCPRCNAAIKKERLVKNKLVSYFCYNCQLLFRK